MPAGKRKRFLCRARPVHVVLEAPDPFLAGADAAPEGCCGEAPLLGGEDTRILPLNRRVGLGAVAGSEPRDHPGEGIPPGTVEAEHPGQRGRRGRRLGQVDLGVHVEVGEGEHEVWKDVVVDVLITTLDTPEPAHHLPLLLHEGVAAIQIKDECGEAILEKMTLCLLRDQAEAAERVGMHVWQMVGLHRVLNGDLPVAVEIGGIRPVAGVRR